MYWQLMQAVYTASARIQNNHDYNTGQIPTQWSAKISENKIDILVHRTIVEILTWIYCGGFCPGSGTSSSVDSWTSSYSLNGTSAETGSLNAWKLNILLYVDTTAVILFKSDIASPQTRL